MYSPPVRLPPVRRREELRPACRGGRPHRTSIRKTDRYGPAVHPAQALPAARCRPPIFHVPALPQLLQCPVRQDTLVPEISICQSPHGPVCPVMGTYIGVAGRPTVAEIEKFSLGAAVQTINHAGRAERGIGMAIRTFDLFCFIIKSSPPKDAPKAARWRLSVQKSAVLAAAGVQAKLPERT